MGFPTELFSRPRLHGIGLKAAVPHTVSGWSPVTASVRRDTRPADFPKRLSGRASR